MQALQIPDVRDFMTKLLTTEIFDTFLVTETTLTTFTTFRMDGSFHADYYDSMDTDEETIIRKSCWPSPASGCIRKTLQASILIYFMTEKTFPVPPVLRCGCLHWTDPWTAPGMI